MKPRYYTIEQMIAMIDEPNRSATARLLADHRKLFQTVQGSTNNHQPWPGGYYDHVQEIMNVTIVLYDRLNSIRPLPFTVSDAILIVFLHDIEKPWKYELGADGQLEVIDSLTSKEAQHEFRSRKLKEYGIVITPDQDNAMKYVEEELKDYSSRRRIMEPLAALCHLADVTSARIWFDHPSQSADPWTGARRIRD